MKLTYVEPLPNFAFNLNSRHYAEVELKRANGDAEPKVAVKKNTAVFRSAGGDRWEDQSLGEWPENDYRIFVGDLGRGLLRACTRPTLNLLLLFRIPYVYVTVFAQKVRHVPISVECSFLMTLLLGAEVTDDMLTRAFAKYPTFHRAKVGLNTPTPCHDSIPSSQLSIPPCHVRIHPLSGINTPPIGYIDSPTVTSQYPPCRVSLPPLSGLNTPPVRLSMTLLRGGEGQELQQVQGVRVREPDGPHGLRQGDERDERQVHRWGHRRHLTRLYSPRHPPPCLPRYLPRRIPSVIEFWGNLWAPRYPHSNVKPGTLTRPRSRGKSHHTDHALCLRLPGPMRGQPAVQAEEELVGRAQRPSRGQGKVMQIHPSLTACAGCVEEVFRGVGRCQLTPG